MKKILLPILIIGAVLGLAFLINERQVPKSWKVSGPTPAMPVEKPSPPAASELSAKGGTNTNLAAGLAPATNATPNPNPPAAIDSAPANSASSPAPPSLVPTIYYQDDFARKGDLEGSAPDLKDANDNSWALSTDLNSYSKNGNAVTDSSPGYDAAYLPVNGASGVPMDGKQNFTLSATMTPDPSGHWMGISLNAIPFTNGQNIFAGSLATLTLAEGYADAYQGQTVVKHIGLTPVSVTPHVISLTYHAAKETLTYSVDDQVIVSIPGVKASQISALQEVSMGNGASGSSAKINKFTLIVGGMD